jgi:hypothetical protein
MVLIPEPSLSECPPEEHEAIRQCIANAIHAAENEMDQKRNDYNLYLTLAMLACCAFGPTFGVICIIGAIAETYLSLENECQRISGDLSWQIDNCAGGSQ